MTTTYVQERMDRLNSAIGAANVNGQADLSAQLQAEYDALKSAEAWEVSDRTYLLKAAEGIWRSYSLAMGPLHDIQQDPALTALGEAPQTTDEINAAVLGIVLNGPGGTPQFLEQVRAAVNNEAAFSEMVIAEHRLWFVNTPSPRPYPYDDVTVLLPVRLETLIENGTLYLRVIPDEASIRRNHPNITPFEIDSLNQFWRSIRSGIANPEEPIYNWLTTDAGKSAWARFSGRLTPERAAWLVSTFLPTPESLADQPTVTVAPELIVDQLPMTNRVGGFPQQLRIRVLFGDDPTPQPLDPPMTIQTDKLEIDPAQEKAMLGVLDGSVPLPDEQQAWWITWEGAVAVGLGAERPLPQGCTADNIQAIYVVGSSEETPTDHFRAQIDPGEMAFLPLGVPTNTVHGGATAIPSDDGDLWLSVAQERVQSQVDPANYQARHSYDQLASVGLALTGDTYGLPFLPGVNVDAHDTPNYSPTLVRALWPALWGHYLRDYWQWGERADQLGLWAADYLYPEGPLPAIRIDRQPYALLPVTALSRWAVSADEGTMVTAVEPALKDLLMRLRPEWAALAREQNRLDLKTTAHLIDLLSRDAVTSHYMFRAFLPPELYVLLYSSFNKDYLPAAQIPAFLDAAWDTVREQRDLMQSDAVEPLLTSGYYNYLNLPLVRASRMPLITLSDILHLIESRQISTFNLYVEAMRRILPDSLLVRLMIYACEVGQAAAVQGNPPVGSLMNPPIFTDDTRIEFVRFHPAPNNSLATKLYESVEGALRDLAGELDSFLVNDHDPLGEVDEIFRMEFNPPSVAQSIERALRATLDTATYRIDPWITGLAWRRLNTTRQKPSAAFRIGVYGWVDGPILGTPGPTAAKRLHSPSHAQALTSIILRDKYISAGLEGDPAGANQWDMNLDSQSIRLADEIAEEARLGSHIYEILGRHVEQIIGTHAGVQAARKQFPLRPYGTRGNPSPNTPCNGHAAMQTGALDAVVALTADQETQIAQLRAAFDVYGDLLMTEAVHHVVTGHAENASAAMEAGAGFAKPPDLDFINTPNAGYTLKSSVLIALPPAAPPTVNAVTSPALVSDPSVAQYVESVVGPADQWVWQVQWVWQTGDGQAGALVDQVTLADVGLLPIDTASLTGDLLNEIVAERSRSRIDWLAQDVGTAPQAALTAPGDRHALARQMILVLGNQPASASDLIVQEGSDASWVAALNSSVRAELLNRYRQLRAAAQQLIDLLNGGDAPTRQNALLSALRWGVVLSADASARAAALQLLFATLPDDLTAFDTLTQTAAAALTNRLKAAPDPDSVVTPDEARTKSQEKLLRYPHDIALAIAELAAPDGKLAILSIMDSAQVQTQTKITADATLNEDWLTVTAAVRSKLAKLEAWQIEAEFDPNLPPLSAWSSSPDDHWLTSAVTKLKADREADKILQMPRFVAAYASADAWANAQVAVGILDSWTEVVPTTNRSTTAAFGFNAPAARPPQAILIAVPPEPGVHLDDDLLLQTLIETRELAHARAARFDSGLKGFVPSTMFEASRTTGIRLDNDTHVNL